MIIARRLALVLFTALSFVAPSAIAEEKTDDDDDDGDKLPDLGGGFELTLAPMTFTSSLANMRFTAPAQSVGLGRTEQFDHRGSAFGMDTPRFWGGELRFAYLRRHLRLGAVGFYAATGGADATPKSAMAANHAVTDRMTSYGGGGELSFVVPVDRITISVGGVVGARAFSMPIRGYEPTDCTPARSQQNGEVSLAPCEIDEASSGARFFAQPQARVDVALGEGGWAFLGVYAGIDLVSRGQSFGLMLGFRTPHSGLSF